MASKALAPTPADCKVASPAQLPNNASVAAASGLAASADSGARPYVAYEFPSTAAPSGGSTNASRRKVSIVGSGAVGCAVASSILAQRLCSELCLIDIDVPKVLAEVKDFQHGMGASGMPVKVYGGSDLSLTAQSTMVFVAAGVRQRPGESRRELLNRNAKLLAPVFSSLAVYSPDTVVCVISNPVDAMTYLASRVCCGVHGMPAGRVFGSGTILDSSRFRLLLAERLQLPITAVHAHVVGEHGDASVSLFSSVNVFGTPLRALYPNAGKPKPITTAGAAGAVSTAIATTANNTSTGNNNVSVVDPDGFGDLAQRVVGAAMDLIKAKGYTSWGIGLCGAAIARAVLNGEPAVLALSTVVPAGHELCSRSTECGAAGGGGGACATPKTCGCGVCFKLASSVAMSLPCELGGGGVKSIMKVALDGDETKGLQFAANKLIELQDMIDFDAVLPKPTSVPQSSSSSSSSLPAPAKAAAAKL